MSLKHIIQKVTSIVRWRTSTNTFTEDVYNVTPYPSEEGLLGSKEIEIRHKAIRGFANCDPSSIEKRWNEWARRVLPTYVTSLEDVVRLNITVGSRPKTRGRPECLVFSLTIRLGLTEVRLPRDWDIKLAESPPVKKILLSISQYIHSSIEALYVKVGSAYLSSGCSAKVKDVLNHALTT